MADRTTSHIPTSSRRKGKRLTKKEREQAQDTFLQAYAMNGNIMLSCKRANIDRSTFYQWCEHDQEFSILYHEAEKDFADFALAEFRKRAMEGYEKPVISMGRVVFEQIPLTNPDGTPKLDSKGKQMVKYGKPMMERVVSDTLLAMLIKRHFPEYRDKQPDINVNVDVNGARDSLLSKMGNLAVHETSDKAESTQS
ncbi:MAG TPA: hypothetical protein VFA10_17925 [Ktedonobacteraceae bacterium]|nr:hypothetical protein [Ktedonobacteraceae bacterium]